MVWLLLRNDQVIAVPEGHSVPLSDGSVFVLRDDGEGLRRYGSQSVSLYTTDERLARLLEYGDAQTELRPRRRRT
jgi:hypothetical protein